MNAGLGEGASGSGARYSWDGGMERGCFAGSCESHSFYGGLVVIVLLIMVVIIVESNKYFIYLFLYLDINF